MDIFVLKNNIRINNYELQYDIYTKNSEYPEVLILCQGFSLSKEYWKMSLIEEIFKNTTINNIVIYNYRGFNSISPPKISDLGIEAKDFQLELLADDLNHFLYYLSDKYWKFNFSLYLLGHSMGTFIVHEFLRKFGKSTTFLKGIIFIVGGCHCSFDLNKMNGKNMEEFVEQASNSQSKRYISFQNLLVYAYKIFSNRVQNKCDNSCLQDLHVPFLDIVGKYDTLMTFEKYGNCISYNWNPKYYYKIEIEGGHHILNYNSHAILQHLIPFFKFCKK